MSLLSWSVKENVPDFGSFCPKRTFKTLDKRSKAI